MTEKSKTTLDPILALLGFLAPYLLPIIGLILVSAAAYSVSLEAGLATTGLSAFIMEWRVSK